MVVMLLLLLLLLQEHDHDCASYPGAASHSACRE
jgi:hypothetical protein